MGDIQFFGNSCGIVSLSWLFWLLWRFYRDATDKGAYFPKYDESGVANLYGRLILISGFYLVLSLFFLYVASLQFVEIRSTYLASLYDIVPVYTAKKAFMISAGYWLFGFFSILFSMFIRNLNRGE